MQTKFQRNIPINGWHVNTCAFENNGRHIGILLLVFILTLLSPATRDFALAYQTLSKSNHTRWSYDIISIFKMAATALQIYHRFLVWWRHSVMKSKAACNADHTFWQNISTCSCGITASGFPEQTACNSILACKSKLHFRFRLWPFHRQRHVILHWSTRAHLNQTSAAELWRHSNF